MEAKKQRLLSPLFPELLTRYTDHERRKENSSIFRAVDLRLDPVPEKRQIAA
jgi:hypothetical protein